MASTHFLFESIFSSTHSELSTLQNQMEELRTTYQSNEQIEISIPYEGESQLIGPIVIEPLDEFTLNEFVMNEPNEPILSNEQINKFKDIYQNHKIEDIDNEDEIQKIKEKLDKKDAEAQQKKLATTICCKENCLQKLVCHEHAVEFYQKFQNLSNKQKDMLLLGILAATTRNDITTMGQKRQRLASDYVFEGIKICHKAFMIIYGIGDRYWNNVRAHFAQEGISPRVHKLTGRVSNSAMPFEKILEILTFIINYANIHGLPSPGRHFRKDTLSVIFLPASESYSSLYRLYASAIEDQDQKILHLTTFWRIWSKYIPEIKFLSPRSDLCYKCKEMRFNSQYWTDQESSDRVSEWNNHFQWAQKEREYYRNCIQISKLQYSKLSDFSRPNHPNSLDFENHLSWDYAEQVKLPFSSQQEGSTYFKSLYNIQVFGICEDALPIQRNYLIKEAESIGKGANAVISLVHNYFTLYGMGETNLTVHADNCAGQNKNNAMMMYLAWRVACGLHTKITYSFMVTGHTKFSPDGFFGLFKLKLRKSEVDNLDDLVNVVKSSTLGGYNQAQTIFDKDGNRVVHFYNWTEFLQKYFKTIPNILKYHHFVFHSNNVGKVKIKKTIDEDEQILDIMKKGIMKKDIIGFPQEIFPTELSAERQWYLYDQVRQHVGDPQKRDDYCPLPTVQKPKSNK